MKLHHPFLRFLALSSNKTKGISCFFFLLILRVACHFPVTPFQSISTNEDASRGSFSSGAHEHGIVYVYPVAVFPEETHTLCLACGVNPNIKQGSGAIWMKVCSVWLLTYVLMKGVNNKKSFHSVAFHFFDLFFLQMNIRQLFFDFFWFGIRKKT